MYGGNSLKDVKDLDLFIVTTFCLVEDIMVDLLGNRRFR